MAAVDAHLEGLGRSRGVGVPVGIAWLALLEPDPLDAVQLLLASKLMQHQQRGPSVEIIGV